MTHPPDDLPPERQPTIEEMTDGELARAYADRFGTAALPHMILPPDEFEELLERMREALRTGKPIRFKRTGKLPPGIVY
jgi:hypothetical protein